MTIERAAAAAAAAAPLVMYSVLLCGSDFPILPLEAYGKNSTKA